jgi:multiple antibiotic resistance protein
VDVLFYKTFWPFFLGSLLSVIAIVNPLSKIPLFLSVTSSLERRERNAVAWRACMYGFAILTGALLGGVWVMSAFGVSFAALRIAGGLTLVMLGYRMLFESRYVLSSSTGGGGNIAFFPLALPGISGPGAIAAVVGISTEIAGLGKLADKTAAYLGAISSIAIVCVVVWLTMRSARTVSRVMGRDGIDVLNRLMGFLLVCIGVQFVGSGIRAFIAGD